MMKNKGMSGFGVIFAILLLIIIGYIAYQIARVYFTYGSMTGMVEEIAEAGPTQSDHEVVYLLAGKAKEWNVELDPDSIIIDRSITDSFRIYVAYNDSSSIFDFFYYTRHFVVDEVEPIKIRF